MSMRMLFGSIIAVFLLGVYVYCVWVAIQVVECGVTSGCRPPPPNFSPQLASTMAVIGGLVSALVVSELAITKPLTFPLARSIDPNPGRIPKNVLAIVTACYLIVWALTGVSAFVVGYLQHPGALQQLTDLGQGWFGVAVASVYVYLGIKPSP